jgi:hypothetical protein
VSVRTPWATGSARFAIDRRADTGLLVTAVECRIGAGHEKYSALLDTGAQWSVIGGDLARHMAPGAAGPTLRMATRQGLILGTLERVSLHLLAEPGCGTDLLVDATILLAPEWQGPIVLGMRGLLERVRFELDPDQTGADCWWSFGTGR